MKSYNHLWEQFISEENIKLAIRNSSRGKRNRREIKEYLSESNDIIERVRNYAEHFHNKPHQPKIIYDGIERKKRTIIVPSYEEQIIHHMAVNVLKPIFMKGMYEHTYASIPNRGVHKGKKTIQKWIKRDGKKCKYCLKMDVRKYFDNIDHNVLKEKLRKKIHDERFLSILETIIDVTDHGLPLGFYTSQWLANWYLQDFDHYVKEKLEVPHYVRYMDDIVMFASNKRFLHRTKNTIAQYLATIGLQVKDNWQVFRFSYKRGDKDGGRFLDFMGFRFYRTRITMRWHILKKALRKARRIKKHGVTIHSARQMLSYIGWFNATDTYSIFERQIKPNVNIRKLRCKVSICDTPM